MAAKSHHYNPQVYLRQFVNPAAKNELWEIDLRAGSAILSSPKKSGCEDFYHSIETPDGRDDSAIEMSFASLENKLPALFEVVRHKKSLSEDNWYTLFRFAALQRARCPKVLNSIQTGLSQAYAHAFELMKHSAKFDASMKEKGLDPEKIRNANIDVKAARDTTLLMSLDVFADGDLIKIFNQMKWHFLVAPPDRFFWTSDDPVCCWAERDSKSPFRMAVGPANSDAEISFPLSRRVCAFAAWKSPVPTLYTAANQAQVDAVNYRNIVNGWRFIYGPTKDSKILAEVHELIEKREKRPAKSSDAEKVEERSLPPSDAPSV